MTPNLRIKKLSYWLRLFWLKLKLFCPLVFRTLMLNDR